MLTAHAEGWRISSRYFFVAAAVVFHLSPQDCKVLHAARAEWGHCLLWRPVVTGFIFKLNCMCESSNFGIGNIYLGWVKGSLWCLSCRSPRARINISYILFMLGSKSVSWVFNYTQPGMCESTDFSQISAHSQSLRCFQLINKIGT